MTRLSWRERAAYGAGDYGLNLFWQGAAFYLFFYYTDVLHLPNAVAGTLFLIGGLWDAAADPVMGYLADRTRTRHGRYRPYLLFGAPVLGLAFILAFAPPLTDDPFLTAAQTLAGLLLLRTAYTVVSIPYSALSARLVADSQERTRLAGVRMYFGFLGGISVVAIGGWLRDRLPDATAFPILAAVCAALALVALVACFRFTRERGKMAEAPPPAQPIPVMLRALIGNRPLMLLFFGIIFVTVATSFITKTVLYVFEYALGDAAAGNDSLYIFTAAPLATIPLWSALALRLGKREAWMAAAVITFLGQLWLFLDDTGSVHLAWAGYAITTLGLSAFGVLFWSMLPDTVEYGLTRTGIRNEALIFGLASSSQKVALAASALFLGLMLDAIGYRAGEAQSDETVEGLRQISTLVPGVAILISAVIISFYRLSKTEHDALVRQLGEDADDLSLP